MKLIPLTQGKFAQVDDSDYDDLMQWKWFAQKGYSTYYASRNITKSNGKQTQIRMHRQIMQTPIGKQVDHKDHNGLHCERHNMRNCTKKQNSKNKTACGNSKYLGVSVVGVGNRKGRITACIYINGKNKNLGTFHTEIEAAKEYDEKAKIIHGEFANLNFK